MSVVTIGVVGEDVESVYDAIQEAGASARTALSEPIDDADCHVAVGESALLALVRAGVETPVLPIGAGSGVGSVPMGETESAVDAILDGRERVVSVPTLTVRRVNRTYRALMDVMVVSTETAKISEYEIRLVADDRPYEVADDVDTVRADGIVASTPIGTPGYGTAAGGPVMDPGLSGLSVVPVGQFRTDQTDWILRPPLSIRVLREEIPVSLLVDDRAVGTVPRGTTVELSWGPDLRLLRTPVSGPFLETQ
ncbi:MAG: ATP-NAD kinase [Halodesulfurarchaeum sp.]